MPSGINAAMTGVLAHQRQVDTAANNLANVNTNGFKKSRVELAEGNPAGVRTTSRKVDTPGPPRPDPIEPTGPPGEGSNVDIAEELLAVLTGERGFEANLKVIQTEDEMLGELLDLVG